MYPISGYLVNANSIKVQAGPNFKIEVGMREPNRGGFSEPHIQITYYLRFSSNLL